MKTWKPHECPGCGSSADNWEALGRGWMWCNSCLHAWDQEARARSAASKKRIEEWLLKNARYMMKEKEYAPI